MHPGKICTKCHVLLKTRVCAEEYLKDTTYHNILKGYLEPCQYKTPWLQWTRMTRENEKHNSSAVNRSDWPGLKQGMQKMKSSLNVLNYLIFGITTSRA